MEEQLTNIIYRCVKGERYAQKELYTLFSPKMFVVCLRYSKNREDAEEVLQEGFMKVFQFLSGYQFNGSFEGWVRKIMVNCALRRYRNKSLLHAVVDIEKISNEPGFADTYSSLDVKDMIRLIQTLPSSYRMVFNLYVFEKMKHREIAEHLGIAEGTSKSHLSDAKALLRKALKKCEPARQNAI